MFRLLVTGSREWDDVERVWYVLNQIDAKLGDRPSVLVHGGARGVDQIAASHWRSLGNGALRIGERTTEMHVPQWYPHGVYNAGAGFVRNKHMVNLGAKLCLAFIKNESNGATQCAEYAESKGIKTLRFIA